MRNLKCYAALPVFLSLILVLNTCLYAQNKTLDRKYDPVIISGDDLSGFESSGFAGVAIDQIYAMTYNGISQTWQMIPFQIDERDTSADRSGQAHDRESKAPEHGAQEGSEARTDGAVTRDIHRVYVS